MLEHRAQDLALGGGQEAPDRRAEHLLERHVYEVRETLIAVDDVARDRKRGRTFLHALDQRAIGCIRTAQREHTPFTVLAAEQQRVDLTAVDGLQIALSFGETRAQFFDVEIVDAHEDVSAWMPRPCNRRSRFVMSPMRRRVGAGPSLT